MAATDTVVGIVGAVLLAAVMVGVFVYEYNNAPATQTEEQRQAAAFKAAYPTLNGTGDLDKDGKINQVDDDIDGDGVPNASDHDVMVTVPVKGSLPSATTGTSTQSFTVHVDPGVEMLTATITYQLQAPQPDPRLPRVPTITMELRGPDGDPVANCTPTSTGMTATCSFQVEAAALAVGESTLTVSSTAPTPGGAFDGNAEVHYVGEHSH
jgi:hypothetical protein